MEFAIFVHFLDVCDVTQFPCPSMPLPFANQFSFNRNLTKMTVFISQILSLHSVAYIFAQASDQSLINFDYNIQIQSSTPSMLPPRKINFSQLLRYCENIWRKRKRIDVLHFPMRFKEFSFPLG